MTEGGGGGNRYSGNAPLNLETISGGLPLLPFIEEGTGVLSIYEGGGTPNVSSRKDLVYNFCMIWNVHNKILGLRHQRQPHLCRN